MPRRAVMTRCAHCDLRYRRLAVAASLWLDLLMNRPQAGRIMSGGKGGGVGET